MSTQYEIPLTPDAQSFIIALAGVKYTLTLTWNNMSSTWNLDIGDAVNNPIVTGVPLVTGADLLEQYGYLNFGGQLINTTDGVGDVDDVPATYYNLGKISHLLYVTSP